MRVRILNRSGSVVEIPSGVPQGSVLGPFLFAAFMGLFEFNDRNVHSTKYADDITIVETVPFNEVSGITLDGYASLFEREGLFVNRSKCKQLCLRRSRRSHVDHDSGFIKVNSVSILGVIFNDNFKWKAQISRILKLASQRLHAIRCLKNCVPSPELIRVFHSIITSVFLYASPVYGKLPVTLMAKLDRFQRRGHRLICGPSCDCNGFPGLQTKFEDATVRLLHEAESNPLHLLHALVPPRLPASGQLRLPACSTTRRCNSFLPWTSRLVNSNR